MTIGVYTDSTQHKYKYNLNYVCCYNSNSEQINLIIFKETNMFKEIYDTYLNKYTLRKNKWTFKKATT